MVQDINSYNRQHFAEAVQAGDLKAAGLWNANIGRSLSLGDFAFVNIARVELAPGQAEKSLFVAMLRGLLASESEIAAFAPERRALLFCCSGPNEEVEYTWSLGNGGRAYSRFKLGGRV